MTYSERSATVTQDTEWHLGQTSARYESGRNGPATISTGIGDHGGVSYGTFQLSSESGTLGEYLRQSPYGRYFKGLRPASDEFNEEWRSLAKTDSGFGRDQYRFIKTTHYDVELNRLQSRGIDLAVRGPAVQDALWSTAVQFGGLAPVIFENGIREKFGAHAQLSSLTDRDIVAAVQDYKVAHNDRLFASSSARVRAALLDRAENERADLITLADGEPLPGQSHVPHDHVHESVLQQGANGEAVTTLQKELARLGYTNSHGQVLLADGDFGRETLHAVEAFQHDHGLAVDGRVGPRTHAAIHVATEARKMEASVVCDAPAPLIPFSDPGHPQQPLYEKLQGLFPEGTSEARLAQATSVCHVAGMNKPDDLGNIYGSGDTILFAPNSLFANMAGVDLTKPVPTVEQSLQQVRQFDQQQQVQVQPAMLQQPGQGPGTQH